ncbi:TonB-linked SusC/RagA family outer membrane protein [Mucilaginibacter frigoritolerans]|uniref:TonB-linked SusC/RagA family outer membrane protein n=1 Tax=Mucilaginibacter frigoritolerans TaxID=652788 RepID=A0A562TNB8_9SPHI|nr:SusC/RagA family TonB-linked outer membrane protein [Mucilaginibacter frigoritolerans]TWI95071.1 TonB-linked SusC/RagA family outer membrane protein [Mucilaginibacter frigoritolerans]
MNPKRLLKKLFMTCLSITLLCCGAYAQSISLKGKVTDNKGLPMPGVTVKIKNTNKVTVTDVNGSFVISHENPAKLVVSFIGFITKEVPVTNEATVTISIAEDAQSLNEVVVTALGVKREKKNLTYSTQQIGGEDLVQGKDPSLINDIDGKVSGVQIVSSSGTPGSSSSIVVRGASSFYGNNQALMVVDGVPVNNDETGNLNSGPGTSRIADIDPSIIESINVLKGAAATALYGSAGAAGVIIITTKTGKVNAKPTINFSSDFSFENALLPQIQDKYAQGTNGVYYDGTTEKTSTSWGPLMDTLTINGQPAKKYNQAALFFKTGHTYNNVVSVAGGGTASNYYLSYSNFDQTGTVPTTEFLRNALFAKYGAKINDKINTTFQLNYTNSQNHRLPEGYALESPVWTIYTAPISYNLLPYENADGTQRLYRYSRNNPYWVLNNISNTSSVNRFLPTFTTDYKPLKWLTVTERFGADVYNETDNYHESAQSVSNPTGRIVLNSLNFRQFNNDLVASANHQFGDFNIDGLIGNNVYSQYSQDLYANGVGLTVPDLTNISSASTINFSESHYLQHKIGVYAQANVDYKRFLILALTGRYDGSSKLATDHSYYPYGSAATSFIASEFFSKELQDVMNLAKIRVSYASVGNDNISPYSLTTPYYSQTIRNITFPYEGQAGFLLSQTLNNPYLQNERINEFETGIETGFFNNRITMEASYYIKNLKDGIIPGVAIAPSTGYTGTTVNTGVMRNKGFELLLTVVPVKTKDLKWDVTINYSQIRSKVLTIDGDLQQIGNGFSSIIVGQPYGVLYGTRYARNAKGQLLIDDSGLPYADATPGVIGNINPDWTGGFSSTLRYKQFNFSVFFDVKKGGDIQNNVDGYGYFYGTPKVTENRAPRVVSGISESTGLPNTVVVTGQAYYQRLNGIEESVIQDGTYIKLRNASIGYTLKPTWLTGSPFKSINVSVTGRNLWIYAPHFTGGDPEVSSFGASNGDQGIYSFSTPTSRSIDFSVKATL